MNNSFAAKVVAPVNVATGCVFLPTNILSSADIWLVASIFGEVNMFVLALKVNAVSVSNSFAPVVPFTNASLNVVFTVLLSFAVTVSALPVTSPVKAPAKPTEVRIPVSGL